MKKHWLVLGPNPQTFNSLLRARECAIIAAEAHLRSEVAVYEAVESWHVPEPIAREVPLEPPAATEQSQQGTLEKP